MRIGPTIKRIRLAKGLTQEQCAFRADLHQTRWAKIERDGSGTNGPTLMTMCRVAVGLDVPVADLFAKDGVE